MAIMADPEDKMDRGRLTPNSSDSIKLNAKVFIPIWGRRPRAWSDHQHPAPGLSGPDSSKASPNPFSCCSR